MEEKLNSASRWLLALAVILIPLTVMAMISSVWGLNYQFNTNQWTRYLIFASWILLALSAVLGISSIISPPEAEPAKERRERRAPASASGEEDDEVEETVAKAGKKPAFNVAYAFLLAQASSLALGLILFVAYVSWLVLGLQAYPASTGF